MNPSTDPSQRRYPRSSTRRIVDSTFAFMAILAVSAAMSFPIHAAAIHDMEAVKEASVTFKTGTVIEIAFASAEGGKEALPEYFEQSDAPKQKYGPPKFLVDLKPIESAAKEDFVLQPNMSGIVEWTSTGAYLGLIADPDFKIAVPLLEQSVTRLDMVHSRFDFPQ